MISGMEILNLKRILEKNPKSLLFAILADSLRVSSLGIGEKLDEALKIANKGLDANPDFLQGLLVRGRILLEKGDLQGAKIDFETVAMRDPFCLSAQKLLIETSGKLGQPLETDVYAKILSAFGTDENIIDEPNLVPFDRTKKTEAVVSLSSALDDVLTDEEDDGEAGIWALLLQTVDKIVLKSAQPQPQPQQSSPPPSLPPLPPPLQPSLSLPEVAPSSLIEKQASPEKPPSPTLPSLDALINEQLSSKMEDIPDLTKDMSSLLASVSDNEPELQPIAPAASTISAAPNLDSLINEQLSSRVEDIPDLTKDMASLLSSITEPEHEIAPHVPQQPAAPNLDSLINEQLSSKIEDIPDLTKDMASLLSSVTEPEHEIVPYIPPAQHTAPAAPNLDSLINEQLSSRVEDIPDLTKDMSSLLASVTEPEPEIAPYVPPAQHAAPAAPNLDALISEQLATRVEDIPDLTKDMASLLGTDSDSDGPEPELKPYVPPTKKTQAVNIDDLVNEQLASKIEDVPDLTKDMDALLKHPTVTLAELYMDQGLPKQAIAVYKELLTLEPNNEDLKTKLALAEIQAEA